ncbi:GNAT family N-acetyltransferase [Glutamicibacter sp. PS]|uniref:GNAT family N-acetyltransferase n=1 Tax=Glutamicibacter sp. PS TaxID=3075634 RepID=UPI00284BC491|nr:GNAT family N-acetyltransferase [Glutamicibacter sp. PS]MDR4533472.1 GNAT family N-acetyltransferase [Glutamicibacter sp. PS]
MTTQTYTFRSAQLPADAELLHSWIATEHARFWGMPTASVAEIQQAYAPLVEAAEYHVLIAEDAEGPQFLVELYDPTNSPLAGRYPYVRGDLGLHFLAPQPQAPEPGFTLEAMTAALGYAFAQPGTERVVVEPDIRNKAIQALNSRVGFAPVGPVELLEEDGSTKHALLSICTRADFERVTGTSTGAAHLTPARWATANRHVLAKAIGEFGHERLLEPVALDDGRFRIDSPTERYDFAAGRYLLNHWIVDPASIRHETLIDGHWTEASVNVLDFITSFAERLTLREEQLPTYLEELNSTLAGHCYKQLHADHSSADLAEFSGDAASAFQRIEAAMTEGHPCFVANNGRMGIGRTDYLRYAPETGSAIKLGWLAAHHDAAEFSTMDSLSYEQLLETELGPAERARLEGILGTALLGTSRSIEDYLLMPVHPWQWENRLSTTFANDIANQDLIYLGATQDYYQPQQSIRTFFNRSNPTRHYVKTAMSILNMGFMRGLSADYMKVTPAINQWLGELFDADPYLAKAPVGLLREVAAVGYRNRQFEAATKPSAAQRKMLAALWRESPVHMLAEGETLATMASLLHVDHEGRSFAGALIRRSGQEPEQWVSDYLDAYLVPLVHCLAAYDLAFMPHGENVILVLRDGAISKALMKDLGEEIAVLSDRVHLPEEIRRVRTGGDPVLSIFTDVFDSFFRFLAPLLDAEGLLTEETFWSIVSDRLLSYRRDNPQFAEHFDALGLFAETFPLSCLNRLQLRNNQQMLDLTDQSGGLLYAGDLENPLILRESLVV